jgi:hypothetical protein
VELKTNSRERASARQTPVTVGVLAVATDELGALAVKAAAAGRATVNSLFPGRDGNPHGREPATSNGPQALRSWRNTGTFAQPPTVRTARRMGHWCGSC